MKKFKKIIFILIGLAVLGTILGSGDDKEDNNNTKEKETSQEETKSDTNNSESETTADTDWIEYYKQNNIDLVFVPADVLYSYGAAFSNQTIVTSHIVKDVSSDALKFSTDNNDSFAFSIVSYFENPNEFKEIDEGDEVIIVGKVKPDDEFKIDLLGTGQTVSLEDTHIITKGINKEEIENSRDSSIAFAEEQKELLAQQHAEQVLADLNEYKSNCVTVDYHDVERNPNTYKGTQIVVSGSVVQITEGWFDSVIMRVDQGGGLNWYVTYTRKDENESRILEGDWVTLYGVCDGVESYTNVMGGQVTIPSMSAEYKE